MERKLLNRCTVHVNDGLNMNISYNINDYSLLPLHVHCTCTCSSYENIAFCITMYVHVVLMRT